MIYAFFGDSHSRQFPGTYYGNFSHTFFSGASAKGLISENSTLGHAAVLEAFVALPLTKTVFLMFGGVDVDFNLYHKAIQDAHFDAEAFIRDRATAYGRYCNGLAALDPHGMTKVVVLGAQVSPLTDRDYIPITAKQIGVKRDEFANAAARFPTDTVRRAGYTKLFNDLVEAEACKNGDASFVRIDHLMMDDAGNVLDAIRPKTSDHHASVKFTMPRWRAALKDIVGPYARYERKLARRAKRKARRRRAAQPA